MALGTIPLDWKLEDALARHPGLALVPSRFPDKVIIEGDLRCCRVGPDDVLIDETYAVRIVVPRTFPRAMPHVEEIGGRVPKSFHRNPDWGLCLGAPLAQALAILNEPTLGTFIDQVVIPYLFSYAYFERFGRVPFGELAHGVVGLDRDLRRTFRLPRETSADDFLRLASLNRRVANKRPCPCGSGRRLGRCHHLAVNDARRRLGRAGCRRQHAQLVGYRNPGSLPARRHAA